VERSRRVLDNPDIHKICLFVGPMSLSGSTRLQATTVLQLAAGAALLRHAENQSFPPLDLPAYVSFLRKCDYGFLVPFVETESLAYQNREYLLYETRNYAITILTDTTERSPTFSLPGFENQKEPESPASLSYVTIPDAETAAEAWRRLLLRDPIALDWKVLKGVASEERLFGFDFSESVPGLRAVKLKGACQHRFEIERRGEWMEFRLGETEQRIHVAGLHPLAEHLLLKMLLNAHSTLVMARLGRIEGNVMTWVRPSNNKLIDRAIRYVQFLLGRDGVDGYEYRDICHQLFLEIEELDSGESVVLKTAAALKARARPAGGITTAEGKSPIKASPAALS
jgi:N-acetylmuramic acid 6-phosphate etherase